MMVGRMDGCGWMDGWMDGNGLTDVAGWMDGWMDGKLQIRIG